jgi:hypothetical protein
MKGLIILIPLVIALNGLWFWVKSILSDNGYKTSYWFHFSDIFSYLESPEGDSEHFACGRCCHHSR